ncbi:hypothetical protein GH714_038384 [Hevea brasiliensis]|uniref:Ty3 transposon capsid-like protein domain-containing protein n=1 Tax=Hevea brasiliensis TaxID=3981 RepID=A0A6A6KL91_HEVBR|nr:hypothetical protein GH714_038384 [Hevea brasiliensis]
MMMDIKAMVAGLSLQNNELAGNRGQSSNTTARNRFNSPNPHSWHHSTKLEFPRFDGNDLETWLLKTEYYFEVVNVLPESRVKVAALHLEGKAILWHQGYVKIKGLVAYDNWQKYVGSLRARFGKQGYDDPLAELKNLKQTHGLQEYLDTFDALYPKARVREDQALSFFLSGLIDELQMPVRMFKPQTLAETYALAKLQEITIAAIQSKPKPASLLPGLLYLLMDSGRVSSQLMQWFMPFRLLCGWLYGGKIPDCFSSSVRCSFQPYRGDGRTQAGEGVGAIIFDAARMAFTETERRRQDRAMGKRMDLRSYNRQNHLQSFHSFGCNLCSKLTQHEITGIK